jgi:hypothetical protein
MQYSAVHPGLHRAAVHCSTMQYSTVQYGASGATLPCTSTKPGVKGRADRRGSARRLSPPSSLLLVQYSEVQCSGAGTAGDLRVRGPELPLSLWQVVLSLLPMLDLIRAAPTCRLFREALRERVRAVVNRCLQAAEEEVGTDLLSTTATAVSLSNFGLDAGSLEALPAAPPSTAFVIDPAPGGKCRVLSGENCVIEHMHRWWVFALMETPQGHVRASVCFLHRSYDDVLFFDHFPYYPKQRPQRREEAELGFRVDMSLEELELQLGLLLSILQVRQQPVPPTGSAAGTLRVPAAWWVEAGYLRFNLQRPKGWDGAWDSGVPRVFRAVEDLLAIAVALQIPCEVVGGFCDEDATLLFPVENGQPVKVA